MTSRCTACGRPIADRRSQHVGMGRACALRTGHVWALPRAERVTTTTKGPRVRRRTARRTWEQMDLWIAATDSGNSNAPAGEIARASCPQP